LDLFTIGIGPSSSHSVGPMRAAKRFVDDLFNNGQLEACARVETTLYGSLALTGRGHGTDKAVMLGLMGKMPDGVDVDSIDSCVADVRDKRELLLAGLQSIRFVERDDLIFDRKTKCEVHPNQMRFVAFDGTGAEIAGEKCYSIGGGFVLTEADIAVDEQEAGDTDDRPYPFRTGADLQNMTGEAGLSISGIVLANERATLTEHELREGVLRRWSVMKGCVEKGCRSEGILPGGLKVRRRAPHLFQKLSADSEGDTIDPLAALDWVNLFALAVNEENAAGGRVVTAPTNGAAGIIPAVLHYFMRFCDSADEDAVVRFFLTAGAIAMLYKENASISGAEVGCQGEVGVACSMAAGALTEVLGGTPQQALQAAEIGMEHHLGLTCDPIGGLVQVPCIERNAVASVTAINSSRLALAGDGDHRVSLDKVIATMRQTGADMSTKYKETARGGLAIQVNVIEC
ncbi:MAG: L-serine ammonia-lyase, partial [Aeoliella sp.]